MKTRLLAALFGLFAVVLPLQAQRAAESVSHEMIVGALRQLDSRFSVDDWKYAIDMGKWSFKLYRLDDGKRLGA